MLWARGVSESRLTFWLLQQRYDLPLPPISLLLPANPLLLKLLKKFINLLSHLDPFLVSHGTGGSGGLLKDSVSFRRRCVPLESSLPSDMLDGRKDSAEGSGRAARAFPSCPKGFSTCICRALRTKLWTTRRSLSFVSMLKVLTA